MTATDTTRHSSGCRFVAEHRAPDATCPRCAARLASMAGPAARVPFTADLEDSQPLDPIAAIAQATGDDTFKADPPPPPSCSLCGYIDGVYPEHRPGCAFGRKAVRS